MDMTGVGEKKIKDYIVLVHTYIQFESRFHSLLFFYLLVLAK